MKMKTNDVKKRIVYMTKQLFMIEGAFLLAVGINDVVVYNCTDDLQCTRLVNIAWLLIGLASLHSISAIFVFFYSCTINIYQPFICYILWTLCISSLVFYHTKQVWNIEQVVSTHMAITLALVTTYCILVVAVTFCHVKLVCLYKQDHVENIARDVQSIARDVQSIASDKTECALQMLSESLL